MLTSYVRSWISFKERCFYYDYNLLWFWWSHFDKMHQSSFPGVNEHLFCRNEHFWTDNFSNGLNQESYNVSCLPTNRSSDGKILVVASTDGYCTLINFEDEELGVPYKDPSKTVAVDTKDNVTVTQVKGDSSNQRSSEVGSNNVAETKKSPGMVVKTTSPPSNMSKNKGN